MLSSWGATPYSEAVTKGDPETLEAFVSSGAVRGHRNAATLRGALSVSTLAPSASPTSIASSGARVLP